jgi:hypothetical protein
LVHQHNTVVVPAVIDAYIYIHIYICI